MIMVPSTLLSLTMEAQNQKSLASEAAGNCDGRSLRHENGKA